MREVLYKNLTSTNYRKRDIFLKEIFEKDGFVTKTERRFFYFIKDIKHVEKEEDFKEWMENEDRGNYAVKRHFYIFKKHDDNMGEDKLMCKIAGTFYAVADSRIYTIGFLHCFKVSFVKATLTQG